MTEFTKTKMHFALALIGALFALHPFIKELELPGLPLPYLEQRLEVLHTYALIAGLLALAVYCYALVLLSEHASSWIERVGNYAYALAIMLVPFYVSLYLLHVLALQIFGEQFVENHLARTAPLATIGVGVLLFLILSWWMRNRLSRQDQTAKIEQLEKQEIEALKHTRDLFAHEHYDLSVIEAWKAIEARLRRVLLQRGVVRLPDRPQKMIDLASHLGIVREPALGLLQELRRQWNVAVGTEPLTAEAADAALNAARHILATIAVVDPKKLKAAV